MRIPRGHAAAARGRRTAASRGVALAVVLAVPLLLALPATVAAHAELESASPPVGATVDVPPTTVSATFSEALIADRSSIELRQGGETIASGGTDPADPATLRVDVAPLAPGTYAVRWTAATDDGHIERGRYEFRVIAGSGPGPTPRPTAAAATAETVAPSAQTAAPIAPTQVPSGSPSASPAPGDGGGESESIGQILAVAAVGIGLGLGIGWWRSRKAA